MKKKLLLMIILMFTCMTESIALSVGEVFLIDVDGVINVRFQVTSISPERTVRIGIEGTVVLDPHGSPQGGPTYYSNDAYTYGPNNNPQNLIDFFIPETVTGPDGNIYNVTSISDGAFSGKLLNRVTIPRTVETIGGHAFQGCTQLTSVQGGENVKHIEEYAFEACSKLWIFKLSNVLESIGDGAFYRCSDFGKSLKELPSTLKSIGQYAFARSDVTSIVLPSDIDKIEQGTFFSCTSLTSVTIPETVTEIGLEAFSRTALRTVNMHGVERIGSAAFAYVTTLTQVTVGNVNPPTLASDAFDSYSATLTVPKGCASAYQSATNWRNFTINESSIYGVNYVFTANVTGVDMTFKITKTQPYSVSVGNGSNAAVSSSVSGAVNIPMKFKLSGSTYTVTGISDKAFFLRSGLTEVTIPNSVTSIGANAFYECNQLTSVTVKNVEPFPISQYSFPQRTNATLYVPEGSEEAYENAQYWGDFGAIVAIPYSPEIDFADENVKTICVTNWDTDGDGELSEAEAAVVSDLGQAFRLNDKIASFDELQYFTGLTRIGEEAFYACHSLTSINLPEGVSSIDTGAFWSCDSLVSISLPKSITSINTQAFRGCKSLASISLPERLTSIGEQAFVQCPFTSVTIPESVTTIGNKAFYLCHLTDVTMGSKVTSIGENAFLCSNLTFVRVGMESPISISRSSFSNYTNATLFVPVGSKEAYENAPYWSNFGTIKESIPSPAITFADSKVKAICVTNWDTDGNGELSLPEAAAVTSLGELFKGNTQITSFDELQYFTGLTNIGDDAFRECSGLTSVTIPNSVTSIGGRAFCFCSGLTSIKVEAGNPIYDSRGNCNAIIKTETNELISGCKNTVIPNSVTSIGNWAFFGCSGLTSVTIPNSVTSIGTYAFRNCTGLTSVTIPSSVTSIGMDVFLFCFGLASINVESGNTVYDSRNDCNAIIKTETNELILGCKNTIIPNSVTSIAEDAFYGCTGLTSVTIPNSVTSIGIDAFCFCNSLTSVTIGNSVTSIGETAFGECSALTSVTVGMETPPTINNVFTHRANATLYVPAGCKAAYEAAAHWQGFKDIVEVGTASPVIVFADAKVKALCLAANWDTNGDGELSEAEAAAVTSLGDAFIENAEITSFDELRYFTGLTELPTWYSFNGCSALRSIVIPKNVTYIWGGSFANCAALELIVVDEDNAKYDSRNSCNAIIETATDKLVVGCQTTQIPDGITTIGDAAFWGRWGMQKMAIPETVTTIESNAFAFCVGLSSITLPASVTTIGNQAFNDCNNLSSVQCYMETPPDIAEDVFTSRANAMLFVPSGCKATYEAADYWKEFRGISDSDVMVDIVKNGDLEGTDVSCFFARDVLCGNNGSEPLYDPLPATIVEGEGKDGSRCIKLQSAGNPAQGYDTQLFIRLPQTLPAGTKYHVSFDYKASKLAYSSTQVHAEPSDYIHWEGIGGITFNTEWQHYDFDGFVTTQQSPADKPMRTIAFNLAEEPTATTYYFDNIVVEIDDFNYEPEETVIEVTDISQLDNVIYIEPMEEMTGSETAISIKMKNTAAIRGFQFDLMLPEGVTPVVEDNVVLCDLNEDRAPQNSKGKFYHDINATEQSDGSYRVLCGSQQAKTFLDTDGEVAVLYVNIASDMAEGDYPVVLKNIKLTETDISISYQTEEVVTKLSVFDYIPGDINGDRAVDVSDYIGVANHILGNTPSGFNSRAADVNADNAIDVSDYIGIANIILTGSIYGHSNGAARFMDNRIGLDPQ